MDRSKGFWILREWRRKKEGRYMIKAKRGVRVRVARRKLLRFLVHFGKKDEEDKVKEVKKRWIF